MYTLSDEKQNVRLLGDDAETESQDAVQHSRRRYNWTVVALAISNLLFLAALVFTNQPYFSVSASSATTTNYDDTAIPPANQATTLISPSLAITEIADALPFLQIEQRRFSGELAYNTTSRQLYRETNSAEPQYFGKPSPGIDAAWHELMENEYIVMTEEEAAPFGDALRTVRGKKRMETSYMHALHCLNALRKKIDHDYYKDKPSMWRHYPAEFERTHDDHCMDFIFQQIICAADLTPSPLFVYDDFNIAIGRTGVHTCRNWDKLREWQKTRSDAGGEHEHEHEHEHEGPGA